MEPFETFEHAGFVCELGIEEESDIFNPRDWDNLGTMVCWHPDYTLGDEQIAGDSDRGTRGAVRRDRHGSASTLFQTERGRTDFRSMETIERYLRLARGAVVVLPLYLLDHSGLAMTAGTNTVGRGDTASGGRDSWGNPHGWDTTMCGFVYTTPGRILELCGEPVRPFDAFYCPRDWSGTPEAWIASQLAQEVETYSQFLAGEVYYWRIVDEDGDTVEGCGGYFRDDTGDGLDYLRAEARDAAESERDAREARRRETQRGWAMAHRLAGAL